MWWLAFAELLHIPPWDIGRLTVEEFQTAIRGFEELKRSQERTRRRG